MTDVIKNLIIKTNIYDYINKRLKIKNKKIVFININKYIDELDKKDILDKIVELDSIKGGIT